MCDSVYTRFNLNFDHSRTVSSGRNGMGRGTDFRGDMCVRIWESVHPLFTSAEFLH